MDTNEVAQQTGYPYQKGPIALGVFVGMFTAVLLWLVYLRLDFPFGNLIATLVIFVLSTIAAVAVATMVRRIRKRSFVRKREERLGIQDAETRRKMAEAREAGLI